MKFAHFAATVALAGTLVVVSASSASATQYTTSCSSGQWDMLSLMFMQQSYLAQNYYVYGTSTAGGNVLHNDVVQISTQHNGIWDTGKINSVKDYQAEPGHTAPPYWGYPWDINLFDDSYVYLWITELNWGDPWSYKPFNNGSTNSSMRFTGRCVVPGDDGTTSQLVNNPKGQGNYTTEFFFVPSGTPTNTPADCNTSRASDLGYAIMNVLAPESNAFTLQDTIHGGDITLDLLPVTYRYNCTSGSGNGGCKSKEEFDFGYDASKNNYGMVRWTLFSSADGGNTWSQLQQSAFDQLKQWTATELQEGKGGTTVSFPCNPI